MVCQYCGKRIRIFLVLLCLAVLVWAATKTYETNHGLWMGYKWYPILSSDKSKKEISYGSASMEQMKMIIDYIDKYSSKSYWAPGEKENSIVKINRIASIKGFRKFLYEGKPCLYCVYENQSGGRMIIIFEPLIDMKYEAYSYFYFEKILSVEEVDRIKKASDREEVLAIDPGVEVKMNNLMDDAYEGFEENEDYEKYEDHREYIEYIETTNQQSVHVTDDGYIRVQYDLDGRVLKVFEQKNAMLRMIMEMEKKGITINLYNVPYDLLPEDAKFYPTWNKISCIDTLGTQKGEITVS